MELFLQRVMSRDARSVESEIRCRCFELDETAGTEAWWVRTSTHVAIGSSRLDRTRLFSSADDGEMQAKVEGVARKNPLRLAK